MDHVTWSVDYRRCFIGHRTFLWSIKHWLYIDVGVIWYHKWDLVFLAHFATAPLQALKTVHIKDFMRSIGIGVGVVVGGRLIAFIVY